MGTFETLAALRQRQEERAAICRQRPPVAGGSEALVLLAASSFPGFFTFTDLVVACHARFPEHFALSGRSDLPDSRAVHCRLYGRRGLLTRGQLRRDEDDPEKLRVVGQGRPLVEVLG